jgi:hypothetical protein
MPAEAPTGYMTRGLARASGYRCTRQKGSPKRTTSPRAASSNIVEISTIDIIFRAVPFGLRGKSAPDVIAALHDLAEVPTDAEGRRPNLAAGYLPPQTLRCPYAVP